MENLSGKKIALIGGAGFIGHHLALDLTKKGAEVHVLDGLQVNNLLHFASGDLNSENRMFYLQIVLERLKLLDDAKINRYTVDARDYNKLSVELDKIKPKLDIIVQLAAVAHADRSNKDPLNTFDHSLKTLENALDYAKDGVDHFIYFSSSMAYGNFLKEEVDEEHPLNPINIYGTLKDSGEKLVKGYHEAFGLNYTIVRPSALYGPRCVSGRVIQKFIENAMNGLNLQINGDGSDKTDFTYIDDLVEGIELIITNPEASKNQIFNMTYGKGRSLKELADLVKTEFPNIGVEYTKKNKAMPTRGTLSVKKAKEMLGYSPKNPLEVGFAKYLEWYKQIK